MPPKSKPRSLPKYYRISQEIVARIQNGELATGRQVPSENEIIKEYGVSNTTARKALHDIEQAGWVKRIKGKGTYVCRNSVGRSISRILSFTQNMQEQGRTPSTKLIDARIRRTECRIAVQGRQYTLEPPSCEIQRLRLADGVPMMKEVRVISSKLCPGIETQDLESSLYALYERQYGIHLERICQMLSTITLDEQDVRTFGLEAPTAAFCVDGVTFCGTELIVDMEKSIYRGDMYRFMVEAT